MLSRVVFCSTFASYMKENAIPLTVRIDADTRRLIERLARKKGQTKSEIIRDAIDVFSKQADEHQKADRPFDIVRDLIGCVRVGPPDLSEQTGRHFRRLLTTRTRG